MGKMKKAITSWSGGKDSAMAFYEAQKTCGYDMTALLTTVTEGYERISMHGVRRTLLEQQAESLGVSLTKVYIPQKSSNKEYEERMRETLLHYKGQGISSVITGDIFLEDLRKYREEKLAELDMTGIFPLWRCDTAELARSFIDLGFKAVVTCVDSDVLDWKFVGRAFDREFLSELPSHIDPCGENGEFHSFVFDGAIFHRPVSCQKGEVVLRDNRFYYCDLVPARAE
jgi:uncharacterized protein (TIGR00290 family)